MLWFGGPIRPNPDVHSAHVSITDVFPTLCEAMGVDIPQGVQGRSLWPLLLGQSYSRAEFSSVYVEHGIGGRVLTQEDNVGFGAAADTVYIDGVARTNFDGTQVATSGYRRAVVQRGWKLIYDDDLPLELYDLENDPWELNNLAQDARAFPIRDELFRELVHWSIRLDDNLGTRRYTVKSPRHNWYR